MKTFVAGIILAFSISLTGCAANHTTSVSAAETPKVEAKKKDSRKCRASHSTGSRLGKCRT